MTRIPGQPLDRFLAASTEHGFSSAALMALQDADVILGRDVRSDEEFVVFGREILRTVADGADEGAGYNVLCIEIHREAGTPDLELLLELVESIKGSHEFIDYGHE